jgi:serine/threonine protein kinase
VELEYDDATPSGNPKITGKITDFGLSSILGSDFQTANSQMSDALKWRAPELSRIKGNDIKGREKHLEKADVWSFGLTSLEVSTLLLLGVYLRTEDG